MRLLRALSTLLILICPCALCYGQVSFSSVHGERGYSALRGSFALDPDNGWKFIPHVGYYRMSDSEQDEKGSTSRYGLFVSREITDDLQLFADFTWHPKAIGYVAVLYDIGATWHPFYYWYGFKNPFVRGQVGQGRYRSLVNNRGERLEHPFRENDTHFLLTAGSDIFNWNIQAAWQKVLKYSEPLPADISFSWAEIPYMSAVVQGFVKDAYALRAGYQSEYISPYAGLVHYQYAHREKEAFAVLAGLKVQLWGASFLGGVEVFEPRREETRKTFFSFSVEAPL